VSESPIPRLEGCYEEAEEVDVVERRFVLRRHKRQKYRCDCGGCVETALGPPKLQPGGRYSVDFAVEVAVAKYQVPHAAGAAGENHAA